VETPLGVACRRGHVGLCQVLLSELAASPDRGGRNYGDGVDSSCRYSSRTSPLSVATQCRYYEIVKLLISHGAKTTVSALKTSESPYPTESAIRNDDLDMLKLLVEEGAHFPTCYNPISEIRFRRCGSDIIEFLVAATKQGSYEELANFIKDALEYLFDHFLRKSYFLGDLQVFIKGGLTYDDLSSIVNHRDGRVEHNFAITNTLPPIVSAATNGNVDLCKLLLSAGANPNESSSENGGRGPLHLAAELGHLELCEMLLNNDAILVDEVDREGWTALHLVLYFHKNSYGVNTNELCALLLTAGASIMKLNNNEDSAFSLAVSNHDVELMNLCLSAWDSRYPNGENEDGDHALHVAVTNPEINLPVLNVILEHNSKALSVPDGVNEWLPFHLASLWDVELDVLYTILRRFPEAVDKKHYNKMVAAEMESGDFQQLQQVTQLASPKSPTEV
jgi:ankyrin repeat protein